VNKVSDALSKVVGETDVEKKLAVTGSYVRPMSPAKVIAANPDGGRSLNSYLRWLSSRRAEFAAAALALREAR